MEPTTKVTILKRRKPITVEAEVTITPAPEPVIAAPVEVRKRKVVVRKLIKPASGVVVPAPAPAPAPAPKTDGRKTREHRRLKHDCVSEDCKNIVKYCYEIGHPVCCSEHIELCKELHDGREPFDTYRDYCQPCLEKYYAEKPTKKPTRATYGKKGDKKPTLCIVCANKMKDPDIVDLVSAKCIGKSPTDPCKHGRGGGPASATIGDEPRKPKWCAHCKPKDTKTVSAFRSCKCGQTASYGPEKGPATHCVKCAKKEGLDYKDTVHKKCACGIQATYGVEGDTIPTYCATCAKKVTDKVLVDIKNKQCKHTSKCRIQPSYGYAGGQAEMCKLHAQEYPGMIDLHHTLCSKCETIRVNEKYGPDICAQCYFRLNPNAPLTKNFRTKELHVRKAIQDLLLAKYPDAKVLAVDKTVPGGCSKRRPDFAIDAGTHIVIVECDENQHQSYDSMCENKRMMELFMDCGSIPIYFIRFNPDAYYDETRKKVYGCFSISKKSGLLEIYNASNWPKRKRMLCNIVSVAIETIPEKEVSMSHLFYDGAEIQGDISLT